MIQHIFRFSATYFIFLILVLVGLYYQPTLPDIVVVQWGLYEQPTNYMSREAFLWTIPCLSLLTVWLVMFLMGRKSMKDPTQTQSSSVVSYIAFVTMGLFLVVQLWIIYANTMNLTMTSGLFVTYLFSALLVVLGNVMSKIKPNKHAGFRTPWTLKSDETWRATHRFAGRVMITCGVLMLLGSFVSHDMLWTTSNATFWWLLGILSPCVYSFIHYRNNKDRV